MLTNREVLEKSIDDTLKGIHKKSIEILDGEKDSKAVLDKVCNYTVQKVTIESKTLLSSIYTNLSSQTLGEEIFKNPKNAATFYKRDIRSDLDNKFDFQVPEHINYSEANEKLKSLATAGVIVLTGAVISICMEKIVPVAISVILAGIMGFVLSKYTVIGSKTKCKTAIEEYLNEVKLQLLLWMDEIVAYYDNCVEEIKNNF